MRSLSIGSFMKIIFIVCFLISMSFADARAQSSLLSFPKVFIEYGSSLDLQACPAGISPVVLQEAQRKMPELQNLWSIYEKDLLGATTVVTGKPFLRREETVSTII